MTLLKLAWRNVLRNRRRSAITIASIALGLAALTFLWGFIDGMNRQMVENTTRLFAGDMQIHLTGYHDDPTLLVVATAVTNTVFMAVAERTREFGVLMALGTSPAAIQRMVVYETLVLMALALLVGYGAGAPLVEYFGRKGIDLSGFFQGYSAIPGLTGIIYPKLFPASVAPPGLALLATGVLVSLYPAAKAARLDPARAIRHV